MKSIALAVALFLLASGTVIGGGILARNPDGTPYVLPPPEPPAFVGKIVHVDYSPEGKRIGFFAVDRSWGAPIVNPLVARVTCTYCNFSLVQGGEFLVFARADSDGILELGGMTRGGPLADRKDYFERLGEAEYRIELTDSDRAELRKSAKEYMAGMRRCELGKGELRFDGQADRDTLGRFEVVGTQGQSIAMGRYGYSPPPEPGPGKRDSPLIISTITNLTDCWILLSYEAFYEGKEMLYPPLPQWKPPCTWHPAGDWTTVVAPIGRLGREDLGPIDLRLTILTAHSRPDADCWDPEGVPSEEDLETSFAVLPGKSWN